MRKLVALAVIAACYTERKPVAAPAPGTAAAVNPYARTVGDPLGFLPHDAEVIIQVDATALRRTPLWARIEPALIAKTAETLEPLRAACGFDPVRQIDRLMVGVRHIADSEGVLVISGVDRAQIMGCMVRVAKSAPQSLHIEHNVVVLAPEAGEKPVSFLFVDATTLVVVVGPDAKTSGGVRAVVGAGSPVRANTRITAMFSRITEPHHAWMIVDGDGQALASFAALGAVPEAFLATADAPDGAAMQAVFHMKATADATNVAATLNGQVQAVRSMVDKLDVRQDGADVTVDVALDAAQLTMMLGLLGM